MPPSKSQTDKDAKITTKYKRLLQHVSTSNDLDGELQKDTEISDNLNRAEALFEALYWRKPVGNASDMALDASVVRHISRDIKNRVRGININGDAAFKFSEFATKVAGLMNTERDDGDAGIFKTVPSRWEALGAKLAGKFRRVPSLSYLYGSVGDEPEAKPAKIAKVKTTPARRTRRKGYSTRVSSRRRKVNFNSEGDEEQMVDKMVDSLYEDLIREFKRSQHKPVNFYEFVCDPTGFANTVENIFHVSFLVKKRKVAMVDSRESSLPELIPINTSGNCGHMASRDVSDDQRVVSIDRRQYEEFVRIFGIKEPMVKRKSSNRI